EERRDKIYRDLKKADKIICICEEMKKEVLEEFQLDEDKIITIYNGLDFEKIRNMSKEIEKLSEEELKLISNNYVLMVSRLEEKSKDFGTLIKAFKKVQESDKNLLLYIVGDGPDKESILKKIQELGLEKKVFLLGRKDNPYIWMKNSKVLIQSSFFEGFGLVLLEGLILGKKIVSTDFKTGAREILSDGKFGKIVPIGDYEKMSAEILNLIKGDKDLEFNLKNENFDQFKIHNTVRQIEEILSR
ncbi:MAG: glycosyltransferase, partial [Fusobacteriaceae bacterium]